MKCEICKKQLNIFKDLKEFKLLKCKDCDHIVTNLKINKTYYKKTYSKNYVQKKHKNWMNNPNYLLFNQINNFIQNNKNGKILDLGCGTGLFLKYLFKKNSNYDLTGVDIIVNKNNKNKNIKFIKKEIYNFVPKTKYKFIISIAVIEHVSKVNKFIKHIKKISSKGSYCIMLTLNTKSVLYKLSHILYYLNIKSPFLRLYDPHHLNHFSRKSFIKFFQINGFDLVEDIKTPINMEQVDYPYSNLLSKYIYYLGIKFIIIIEKIFNVSWLQISIFVKR